MLKISDSSFTDFKREGVFLTFQELLEAAPHDVDVFDADELEADVGVVVLVLIALARRSVGQRVELQGGDTTACSPDPARGAMSPWARLVIRRLTFGLVSIT